MNPLEASRAAELLSQLIRIRTHQPGADGVGGNERALCDHLVPLLLKHSPDEIVIVDVKRGGGGPGAYVFARWGTPARLINAHLDTVPPNAGWTRDPWTPSIKDGRIYGLGSCDIKGAIAATLVALERTPPKNVAVLFSGDEEHGTACVAHFLASPRARGVTHAIVCEPTGRRAGIAHRGMWAYRARLRGPGGHSSKADHVARPIAKLARLAVALDDLAIARINEGLADMKGLCMNIAALPGGIAFNVIPAEAELVFSLRPWPGFDRAAWDAWLREKIAAIDPAIELTLEVDHAPFACADASSVKRMVEGHVTSFGSLDFWTEAALYQAAGIHSIVVGPGDIAQAHSPDEFVTTDDLAWAIDVYARVLAGNS